MILTQFEFDPNTIGNFIERCRKVDIDIPIVVGVFLLTPMADIVSEKCGVFISEKVIDIVKSCQHDRMILDNFSIYYTHKLIEKLLFSHIINNNNGIHIYSMNNLLNTYQIYKKFYVHQIPRLFFQ